MSKVDYQEKLYESVLTSIQNAINYCFLLNGGSIVAVLTFIGNQKDPVIVQKLSVSIMLMAVGVIFAALAAVSLYLAQLSYFRQTIEKSAPFVVSGTAWRIVLLTLVFASIAIFAAAAVFATRAFS